MPRRLSLLVLALAAQTSGTTASLCYANLSASSPAAWLSSLTSSALNPFSFGSLAALPGGPLYGFCAPFSAFIPGGCASVTVPPGAVLSYGTCGLTGSFCVGATALTLLDAVNGSIVAPMVTRVSARSVIADETLGCSTAGAFCSFSEWFNNSTSSRSVVVQQACDAGSTCSGSTAWQVVLPSVDPGALLAPAPQAVPAAGPPAGSVALLFAVQNMGMVQLSIISIAGLLSSPAATLRAYAANASLASLSLPAAAAALLPSAWAPVSASASALPLALSGPSLAPNGTLLLLLSATADAFSCADSLFPTGAPQASDGTLSILQGYIISSTAPPITVGDTPIASCSLAGLSVAYVFDSSAANAPPCVIPPPPLPPAPPQPSFVISTPATLVNTLAALQAALSNLDVSNIEVSTSINLTGTALIVAQRPDGALRTLLIEGTHACARANPATPLCVLDAGGASRVVSVGGGAAGAGPVSLTLSYLQLQNGASQGGIGGCVSVTCPGCSLTVSGSVFTGCSADAGGAIALAVSGTDADATASTVNFTASGTTFTQCLAMVGGAVAQRGGMMQLANTTFVHNIAAGISNSYNPAMLLGGYFNASSAVQAAWAGLMGPSGGAVAMVGLQLAAASGCTFDSNVAFTTDHLVGGSEIAGGTPFSRGGALYAIDVVLLTMNNGQVMHNSADAGGGAYISTAVFPIAADSWSLFTQTNVTNNTARLGMGGGLVVNTAQLNVTGGTIAFNSAAGRGGGGVSVFSGLAHFVSSSLSSNVAPRGDGGAVILIAGAEASFTHCTLQANIVGGSAGFSAGNIGGGGGVACVSCASLVLLNCSLFSNSAGSDAQTSGGAILAAYCSSPVCLTVAGSNLVGNSAAAGGALAALECTVLVTGSTLSANTALLLGGGAVQHTQYQASQRASLMISNCSFVSNQAVTLGGAVYSYGSTFFSLNATAFTSNLATSNAAAGGAIAALGVGTMTSDGCTFIKRRGAHR